MINFVGCDCWNQRASAWGPARGQERSREEFKALQSCSLWKLGFDVDAAWLHKMGLSENVGYIFPMK